MLEGEITESEEPVVKIVEQFHTDFIKFTSLIAQAVKRKRVTQTKIQIREKERKK